MIQQIYLPTKIIFGESSLDNLKKIEFKNIFVICTKHLAKGKLEDIKKILGSKTEHFKTGVIKSEPGEEEINDLIKLKSEKTDCIMGIGGGSYMDSAKALAICEDKLSDFTENSKVLPIITIPTTAGSGAEVTKSSIVRQNGIKRGFRSEKLFPYMAIVDPTLCDSLPLEETKYTAFDILTHATETYCSKKSTMFTRALSEMTLKDLTNALPKALEEFGNLGKPSMAIRSKLSYLAMIQGINLANASTCLPHRIQYAISYFSKASHPRGLASFYRAWLDLEKPKINGFNSKKIKKFMDEIDIKITLSDIGIKENDINKIVGKLEGNLDDDPTYRGLDTIRKLLGDSL